MHPPPREHPELTVRRLAIDLSHGFARHWNGGDAFMSAYANALSMSFPVGEQIFIDAVKLGAQHLADTPENAALRLQLKGFIGQESSHRHVHARYNDQLQQQGLRNHWGPRAEKRNAQGRRLLIAKSTRGHLHELALTAAVEHFTAIFADLTLSRMDQPGDWFGQADEPLKTLWRWHAAEESEHRSVAFDLYQRLGGNHAWRLRWFWIVTVLFSTDVLRQTINNLWHDRSLFKPSTWYSASRFLFGRHGLVWRCAKPLWAYTRKDFHPLQLGQSSLAKDWLNRHASQWSAVQGPRGGLQPLRD